MATVLEQTEHRFGLQLEFMAEDNNEQLPADPASQGEPPAVQPLPSAPHTQAAPGLPEALREDQFKTQLLSSHIPRCAPVLQPATLASNRPTS